MKLGVLTLPEVESIENLVVYATIANQYTKTVEGKKASNFKSYNCMNGFSIVQRLHVLENAMIFKVNGLELDFFTYHSRSKLKLNLM